VDRLQQLPRRDTLQASAGSGDAFISKLHWSGSALVYSTYLGAQSGAEHAYGIALDSAGNAYVTGQTNSTISPERIPSRRRWRGRRTPLWQRFSTWPTRRPVDFGGQSMGHTLRLCRW
jgi:hypothetical protein